MKKLLLVALGVSPLLLALAQPMAVHAQAVCGDSLCDPGEDHCSCWVDCGFCEEIQICPTTHDFGDVALGESSSFDFTITNMDGHDLIINAAYFPGRPPPPEFTVACGGAPCSGTLIPGASMEVTVTFTPGATVAYSSTLLVWSNDSICMNAEAVVTGTGIGGGPSEPPSFDDILDFFRASVRDGTLYGVGPGNSAKGRLKAMWNKLRSIAEELEEGDFQEACAGLASFRQKVDGNDRPPDFLDGFSAPILHQMIVEFMEYLGCPT